jgi:hypothetical protein
VSYLRQTNRSFEGKKDVTFEEQAFDDALTLIKARGRKIAGRFWDAIEPVLDRQAREIERKWKNAPHDVWQEWNLGKDDRPVIRTYEQYAEFLQKEGSFPVPTSMRQVDKAGGAIITQIRPEHIGVPMDGE